MNEKTRELSERMDNLEIKMFILMVLNSTNILKGKRKERITSLLYSEDMPKLKEETDKLLIEKGYNNLSEAFDRIILDNKIKEKV